MNDHNQIRSLLPLQVAGAISREEQAKLDDHLRECSDCRSELASLRALAADLKSIPAPQPLFGLAQRTRARIRAELAAKAERRQNQQYLALLSAFAWLVTAMTFVAGKYLAQDLAVWMKMSPSAWVNAFIWYMIFSAIASTAFAGLVARRHRNDRRLV
jgi:predicted anti-sigma-YlaC factor YlaD